MEGRPTLLLFSSQTRLHSQEPRCWICMPPSATQRFSITLWQIVQKLGCIKAVQSMFAACGTLALLAERETGLIQICRGTLKGASLSPFLPSIAIQSIAWWLHSEGRRHALGSSKSILKVACNAYAGDLGKELALQKIERFSVWAGLQINVNKCTVSGILH